jgi:hypothetical protein
MALMKKRGLWFMVAALTAFLFLTASASDVFAGKWKRKSKQHEDNCKAWCEEHEDCTHCSTLRHCGKDFDTIKSWTGYGKNWHACKKRPSRAEAGRNNKEECEAWCGRNEDCKKCVSVNRCRDGYTTLQKFGGRGTNYYACGPKRYNNPASNRHRDECFRWCEENPLCRTCRTYSGCAHGSVSIKAWKGPGRNFYACARRDDVKAKNKEDCEAWCNERERCVKCDTKKACGYGYLHMKTFGLGNTSSDYHACKRRDSAWGTVN